MATNPMSLAQFGQLIKSKHPEYQDLGDEDLGNRVLAKFPQYKDMVSSMPAPSPTGLANQALAGTGITVNAPSNPAVRVSNAMQVPGAVKRSMTAAGVQVGNFVENLPNIVGPTQAIGTPENSNTYQNVKREIQGIGRMITDPLKRAIVEGDVAGAVGEGAVTVPQAAAIVKGGIGIGKGVMRGAPTVKATPEAEIYSKPADLVASSLRSNARVDMPAEANIAHSAVKEAMADKGYTPDMFTGRNGPQLFKDAVGHAIDLAEARKAQVMEPIKGDTVDPKVFDSNPELASRFKPGESVTYGRLMSELSDMNKELTRGNFYTKDVSDQFAANDALANTEVAANQARSILYDYAGKRTGIDLRPMQRQESALIKLQDSANVTANTLAAKEAQFNATPTHVKAGQSIKNLIAVKNNPMSAFFSYEKPGLTSPTKTFNNNMQRAFFDVEPQAANTTMNIQDNPVPNPVAAQLGFDPNANPSGAGYPDVLPNQVGRNQFGFDRSAMSSDLPTGMPDAVKQAIKRERANSKGGYSTTGSGSPRRKVR